MKTFQRWIKAAYLSASPGLIKSGSEEEGKTKPHTLLAYKTWMLDNEKSLLFFFLLGLRMFLDYIIVT